MCCADFSREKEKMSVYIEYLISVSQDSLEPLCSVLKVLIINTVSTKSKPLCFPDCTFYSVLMSHLRSCGGDAQLCENNNPTSALHNSFLPRNSTYSFTKCGVNSSNYHLFTQQLTTLTVTDTISRVATVVSDLKVMKEM